MTSTKEWITTDQLTLNMEKRWNLTDFCNENDSTLEQCPAVHNDCYCNLQLETKIKLKLYY